MIQTSKHTNSNFNIGNSSMSLKDKQISLTASKKQVVGSKAGDSNLNALR